MSVKNYFDSFNISITAARKFHEVVVILDHIFEQMDETMCGLVTLTEIMIYISCLML